MYGCGTQDEGIKKITNMQIPKPASYQTMFMHPDRLTDSTRLGYTVLSDLDADGKWDAMERVNFNSSSEKYVHQLFYKKGYGPAQSVPSNVKLRFVDASFFKPYE